MKNIIIALLSIFITILLIILGLSISSRSIIVNTTDSLIKEEITNQIIESTPELGISEDEAKQIINNTIEKEPIIKEYITEYFDMFVKILNDEINIEDINIKNEVEKLLDDVSPILEKNGIKITEETKNEIINIMSTEETNNIIKDVTDTIKTSVPENAQTIIKGGILLLSLKFKIFITSIIGVFLLIIAFLKKSYYKWTIDLAVPSLITGSLFCTLTAVINSILIENVIINTSSMNMYGIVNIIIGIVLTIIYIILNKILTKETEIIK